MITTAYKIFKKGSGKRLLSLTAYGKWRLEYRKGLTTFPIKNSKCFAFSTLAAARKELVEMKRKFGGLAADWELWKVEVPLPTQRITDTAFCSKDWEWFWRCFPQNIDGPFVCFINIDASIAVASVVPICRVLEIEPLAVKEPELSGDMKLFTELWG